MTPDDVSSFGTELLTKQYWIDYFNKFVSIDHGWDGKLDPIKQIENIKYTGTHRIFYMIKNVEKSSDTEVFIELECKEIRIDVL